MKKRCSFVTLCVVLSFALFVVGTLDTLWAQKAPNAVRQTVEEVAGDSPVRQPAKTLLPEIVAEVNGEKITREQLAAESMRLHGAEILDRILNRSLVLAECKSKQIHVTRNDVDAEIERLAKGVRLSPEQYLEIVKNDSGMTPAQYSEDVIWPRLALKALVAPEIEVTPEEMEREYLKKYGPSVVMQMIASKSKEASDAILVRVKADPESFGEIAKNESTDLASASNKGRLQPIRHYTMPDEAMEAKFFAMAPGEITDVIGPYGPTGDYMIFKCENKYDPQVSKEDVDRIKETLRAGAVEAKLKGAAATLFERLGKEANVVNVLASPELKQQYPNVAATVNGQPIYLDAVTEKCLDLYAERDLEMMIHLTLIRQQCQKVALQITDADIDTEIWIRAAESTMPMADGSPNVAEYLKSELAAYQVPEAVYREIYVRPALAIKKLSEPLVKVTDDDLRQEFESAFGETVQCLGIVVRDERLARDIWQKARTLPAKENRSIEEVFGDLAAQYSIEPNSRQMRGRIDPINKNGGMPQVEEEAFALKAGELSSVVQVNRDTFVILLCLERNPAKETSFDEVKDSLAGSVRKKKEMRAADQYYRQMLERSAITNLLTGQNFQPATKTLP